METAVPSEKFILTHSVFPIVFLSKARDTEGLSLTNPTSAVNMLLAYPCSSRFSYFREEGEELTCRFLAGIFPSEKYSQTFYDLVLKY